MKNGISGSSEPELTSCGKTLAHVFDIEYYKEKLKAIYVDALGIYHLSDKKSVKDTAKRIMNESVI